MPVIQGTQIIVLSLLLLNSASATDKEITPDLSKVNNARNWNLINAIAVSATEENTPVVRLRPKGQANTPSNIGLAIVEGVEFTEGTLEIDLKGKGKQEASFLGLAFSVVDGNTYEAIYFRPFNFMREGNGYRDHAVQYIAWPEYTWEKLRNTKPGVFESAVKPVPDPSGWFHARVVITGEKVSVWVDDAKKPCLVVDRLASRAKGMVGLWVDSKEGTFRNLQIVTGK